MRHFYSNGRIENGLDRLDHLSFLSLNLTHQILLDCILHSRPFCYGHYLPHFLDLDPLGLSELDLDADWHLDSK